jgi:hypothetical protein
MEETKMWNNLSETKKQIYFFSLIFLGTVANMVLVVLSTELFLAVSAVVLLTGTIWLGWEFAEDWNRWMEGE